MPSWVTRLTVVAGPVVLCFGAAHWVWLWLYRRWGFDWYAALVKPWLAPPEWVLAWSLPVVCLVVCIAGREAWHEHKLRLPLQLLAIQLLLSFLWVPVFFGMRNNFLSFLVSIISCISAICSAVVLLRVSRRAALLAVPSFGWIFFLAWLTGTVWWMNRAWHLVLSKPF